MIAVVQEVGNAPRGFLCASQNKGSLKGFLGGASDGEEITIVIVDVQRALSDGGNAGELRSEGQRGKVG